MTIKFRIILKSFDQELLTSSSLKIFEVFKDTNSKIKGPIPLPTKIKRFCVLRSPHVNKDSREHFQVKIHKRIIDVETNSSLASDRFLKLKLPAGILFKTQTIKKKNQKI